MVSSLHFGARWLRDVPVRYESGRHTGNGHVLAQVWELDKRDLYRLRQTLKHRQVNGDLTLFYMAYKQARAIPPIAWVADWVSAWYFRDIEGNRHEPGKPYTYALVVGPQTTGNTHGAQLLALMQLTVSPRNIFVNVVETAGWNRRGSHVIRGRFLNAWESLLGSVVAQFPNRDLNWTSLDSACLKHFSRAIQKNLGALTFVYSYNERLSAQDVATLAAQQAEKLAHKRAQVSPALQHAMANILAPIRAGLPFYPQNP